MRWIRRIAIACAASAGLANAAAADRCQPWPGEPSPLPRVGAADEMLRRWAQLRVRELESAARALEPSAPARAHRLWRRVLCLDAANDAAAAGISRTPLVAVHEPVLVTRPTPDDVGDAWAGLSHPLEVKVPRPSPPEPAPGADFAARLAELEQQVKGARFEEALSDADLVRRAAPGPAERARVEVLAATAALALGRREEADQHLGLALAEQPDLALDPATTPPKVQRALDRVRAEQSP